MQLLLERMWNKVEGALEDSQKAAGPLEECSNSNGVQSGLDESTFKCLFWGVRFHLLPQSYNFYLGLCSDNFLQVLLICNQRYQVSPFIYIN